MGVITTSFVKSPETAARLSLIGTLSMYSQVSLIGEWLTIVFLPSSSGDSTGSSVGEQMAAYDGLIASHPTTILSLQHEVYCA